MRWLPKFLRPHPETIRYSVSDNFSEALIEIEKNGFAVIELLNENEMKAVEEQSNRLVQEILQQYGLEQFLAVGRIEESLIRNKSTRIINELILPKLKKFFPADKFDFVSGIHLLKPPGKKGILNPHQDSSLVDESRYHACFFWMPVSFVGKEEGTLEIIPGSHLLEIPFRSLNIPWPLSKLEMKLWKFMKKIIVPRGHAVLFHSRLIHGSRENKGPEIRIAVNSFIKPKTAPLLHYYTDDSSNHQKIESFIITPDFFYNEDIMKKPGAQYALSKTEENINKQYTFSELEEIFKSYQDAVQ